MSNTLIYDGSSFQPESVHTIKDALSHLSHPQSVQITSPTRPGQVIDATQTVLIEALPPILVLHLKRFLYDTNVKDVVKIGKKITFERELEIGPDIMASRGVGRPAKYKLFGGEFFS
jgi:ubiquitin carboxyl-terminal hydrolase 10